MFEYESSAIELQRSLFELEGSLIHLWIRNIVIRELSNSIIELSN